MHSASAGHCVHSFKLTCHGMVYVRVCIAASPHIFINTWNFSLKAGTCTTCTYSYDYKMYLLSNLWIISSPNSNSSNSFHRIHVGGRRWNEKKNCATRGEYVISGHMSNRSIKSSASFAQIQSEVGPTSNNTVLSIGKRVTFSRNEWYCSFRSKVSSWKHTHSKRSEITKMNEWIVCARLERISAQKELNQIHSEFRVTFSLFYIKRVTPKIHLGDFELNNYLTLMNTLQFCNILRNVCFGEQAWIKWSGEHRSQEMTLTL